MRRLSAAAAAVMLLALPAGAAWARSSADCETLLLQTQALEKVDPGHALLPRSREEWTLDCLEPRPPAVAPVTPERASAAPAPAKPAAQRRRPPARKPAQLRTEPGAQRRFKVTIPDPEEEAQRLAPPVTQPAGSQPELSEPPVPLL